jgi:hypothetical protein
VCIVLSVIYIAVTMIHSQAVCGDILQCAVLNLGAPVLATDCLDVIFSVRWIFKG